jgi:endonuclease/exonuclease/phosphatase family metal-dependent hydrolase
MSAGSLPTLPADGVRVATLNLWGRFGAWPDRRSVLVDGLRVLRPDLIAFIEAVKTDDYDQVTEVLGAGYHVAHQRGRDRDADGRGVSIASRWPLGQVHEVDLHVTARTAGFPCVTLVAEVAAPAPVGPLLFVNSCPNFQLDYELERELQAVASARFVEELVGERGLHVVLAGDFDAVPDAASLRFWCGRQSLGGMSVCYRNAWESIHPDDPGHTFSPRNPLVGSPRNPLVVDGETPLEVGRRIDHIMVRCGHHGPTLDIAACERIFDEPVDGVWASDHFGVVADLVVPARPPAAPS